MSLSAGSLRNLPDRSRPHQNFERVKSTALSPDEWWKKEGFQQDDRFKSGIAANAKNTDETGDRIVDAPSVGKNVGVVETGDACTREPTQGAVSRITDKSGREKRDGCVATQARERWHGALTLSHGVFSFRCTALPAGIKLRFVDFPTVNTGPIASG